MRNLIFSLAVLLPAWALAGDRFHPQVEVKYDLTSEYSPSMPDYFVRTGMFVRTETGLVMTASNRIVLKSWEAGGHLLGHESLAVIPRIMVRQIKTTVLNYEPDGPENRTGASTSTSAWRYGAGLAIAYQGQGKRGNISVALGLDRLQHETDVFFAWNYSLKVSGLRFGFVLEPFRYGTRGYRMAGGLTVGQ